jgi:glycosyl transferase family 25
MTGNLPWPIIILSLDGEDARRAALLDSLTALGLPYEVFMGIDGRKGLTPRWEAEIDRNAARQHLGRDMTDGEFACALSHREIYRRILQEGWDGAVVLEDDAVFALEFSKFMTQKLYTKADIIMLYHSHARVRGGASTILPGVKMYKLAYSSSGAVGYCLNRKAAILLNTANTPVCKVADWPSTFKGISATVLVPQIVGHPPEAFEFSHLEEQRGAVTPRRDTRSFTRHKRIFKLSFWKSWIGKRLSRRVS